MEKEAKAARLSEGSESICRLLYENMDEAFLMVEVVRDGGGNAVDLTVLGVNPAWSLQTVSNVNLRAGGRLSGMMSDIDQELLDAFGWVEATGVRESRVEIDRNTGRHYEWRMFKLGSGKVGVLSTDVTGRKVAEEALRESEERFRSLFENLQESVTLRKLVLDDEGRVVDRIMLDCNPVGLKAMGFGTIEEVRGKRDSEIYGPAMTAEILQNMNEMRTAGRPITKEVHLDANDRDFLATIVPFRDDCVLSTSVDITETKRAQRLAEERAVFLNGITNSAKDAIFVKDREGRMVLANPAYFELMGLSPEETMGKLVGDYHFDSEVARRLAQDERRVLETGAAETIEELVLTRSGWRVLDTTKTPYRDREGRVAGYIGIARDITERKAAEEALRESEARYHAMFDNLQEAVALYRYILDDEGEVIDWTYVDVNRAYELAFGMPRDRIVGRKVSELLGPGAMGEYLPIVRRVRSENEPAVSENRFRPLDIAIFNLFAPVSEELFVISSLDITEREKFKNELERSVAELQHFADVAGHDLKEPLRTVANYLMLLDRRAARDLDETGREYLRSALDGTRRMTGMIDDLLAYSRVEAKEDSFAPVDLGEVLDTVIRDLRASIEESGASVTIEALPTVEADRAQMVKLLENLVSNAIKYRDAAAPQIKVSARSDGKDWTISVEDNGIGIDPKYGDKLFRMFSRLHTGEQYEGTGMGLAIAKRIVERHGGRIWFESEPGRGTTFSFTIPLSR